MLPAPRFWRGVGQGAPEFEDPGQHDQLLGAKRLGQRGGGGVGIDVVHDAVDVGSDRRDHRDAACANQIQ